MWFGLRVFKRMTLQWTAVALFLYAEIAFILILCLPLLSAQRWQKIFKWNIWSVMSPYWNRFFFAMILILIVLFLDALREVRKYSAEEASTDSQLHPNFSDHVHMMLFRAQRNLYISGFSLFHWLIMRRIITLIHQVALAEGTGAALQAQAEGANQAAKKYMEENQKLKDSLQEQESAKSVRAQLMRQEVESATKDLKAADDALRRSRTEVEAVKKQAQGLTREYDRLLKEHQILQQNLYNGSEDKKDQ
ncbi:B-cell receptor-associated protein 29-like isoform X1 [Alosa pseudoharengus]|uniref:B-cell receptor-associated protein 29-like isoform X1 n=1 Tax=Alosa pseudoharengus TaxID=34774 RepID=UPI003F8AB3CD